MNLHLSCEEKSNLSPVSGTKGEFGVSNYILRQLVCLKRCPSTKPRRINKPTLEQPADPPRAKPASQASGWPARQPDRATLAPGRTSHRPQRARAELERADQAHPRASACCACNAHAALKASAARAGQAAGLGADRGKRQKAGAAASCAA